MAELPGQRRTAHLIPARLAMIQKKICVRAEARIHAEQTRGSGFGLILPLPLYRLDG